MARALFDATGQREVLLDRLPELTMPTLVIWGGRDYLLPASRSRCSPTADTCPTWRAPTGSPLS
jgi:pimeloyl-ACP methyl ester carboxylesterase